MAAIRNILVAVKDPGARTQLALRKAAQLATALGARLELFHALTEPLYADAVLAGEISLDAIAEQRRRKRLASLEKLAAPLRTSGLKVECRCVWDFPAYEAVLRGVARRGIDLIVAERHVEHHVAPWLMRFNDWELLRRSPVPVLLVRQSRPYHAPRILAAVDPGHEYAKPAKLDGAILDLGEQIANALDGDLHALHAWMAPAPDAGALDVALPGVAARVARQVAREAKAGLDALTGPRGLSPRRRHLEDGSPTDVIPAAARRLRAQLVVMGAISRRGLKRLVIGNTAERVFDALKCDVLVVKPAQFDAKVGNKARGLRVYMPPMMV
jgi:universal stress protein E